LTFDSPGNSPLSLPIAALQRNCAHKSCTLPEHSSVRPLFADQDNQLRTSNIVENNFGVIVRTSEFRVKFFPDGFLVLGMKAALKHAMPHPVLQDRVG